MSAAPRPKVAAAGSAGLAATALVTIAGAFGVELAPEAAAAIVTLAAFAAGYLKRDPIADADAKVAERLRQDAAIFAMSDQAPITAADGCTCGATLAGGPAHSTGCATYRRSATT